MVKRMARLVLVMFGLSWAGAVHAQTVEEVLDKSVAAMGGRAALSRIKSRTMTGAITLSTPAGEIPGTIEVTNAAPNKARTVIKADLTAFGAGPLVIDQRFDGQNGYVLDTLQGNRDITGNQLDNMRNNAFPHLYLAYKELGITARLQGREKVGDRDAVVVAFEPTRGSVVRHFIDAATMLPMRYVAKVSVPQLGTEVEQTNDLADYREVDGLKVPFKLVSSSSVQGFTIDVKTVQHNGEVDEKQFTKP